MLSQSVATADIEVLLRREQAVYAQGGFGAASSWGDNPALLVVDVTYGFVGHGVDDADHYPNWCGPDSAEAVQRIGGLIDGAHAHDVPVIYTTGSFAGLSAGIRRLGHKHPRAARQPEDSYTVVAELAPRPQDVVLAKMAPSAFFGTPLSALMTSARIDTIVVAGCSTSGCVRATVVDGFSLGLPVVVVRDGVFDRSSIGHEVTLFEVGQKYADVTSCQQAIDYFGSRSSDSALGRPGP